MKYYRKISYNEYRLQHIISNESTEYDKYQTVFSPY